VFWLLGFYDEIGSPLLRELNIKYLNDKVDLKSLVKENAENYYKGGETVIIGKIDGFSSSKDDVLRFHLIFFNYINL